MTNYWDLFDQGYGQRNHDPEGAAVTMQTASDRARHAGDWQAVLHMNHWILQTLILRARNIKGAFDLAVKTAAESRNPDVQEMKERVCVYQDLILVYLATDPIGYGDLITQAVDDMQQSITRPLQCSMCLQDLRCIFELVQNRFDSATEQSNAYLSMSESSSHPAHHGTIAYTRLCEIAYRRQQWADVIQYAGAGQALLRGSDALLNEECFFLACHALANRKLGSEELAQRYYRLVTSKVASTGVVMDSPYYDVLCDFQTMNGNLAAALGLRDRELEELRDKGRAYAESRCRLERCRLLQQLGKLTQQDIADTRKSIGQLKHQADMIKELAILEDASK